jgi:acetyl-CoA carboxylase biotin carboxyl carrier protein
MSAREIKSPMIGTFYRSPSPESAPYIEVGMEVNPDTVVCIIEAMKVMNEIKAEMSGCDLQGWWRTPSRSSSASPCSN